MRKRLLFLGVVLFSLVALIGVSFAYLQTQRLEQEIYTNLQSIAKLKTEQIEQWLRERRGDGEALLVARGLNGSIIHLLQAQTDAQEREYLSYRFRVLRETYGYSSVLILNPQAQVLLSSGTDALVAADTVTLLNAALTQQKILRSELYLDAKQAVVMDWIIPVLATDAQGSHAVAAIVLRIDAQHFLYPTIETWPVASTSAETLLVRKSGEQVLYLNELRHRKRTAFKLMASLQQTQIPAVRAVQVNQPNVMRGVDYRETEVFAASRPVADTDWFLVAKIDRAEILAPMWSALLWILSLLMLATVGIFGTVWRILLQQQKLQTLEAEQEKVKADRLLRYFFELPFIGMAITSPTSKQWVRINDRLCAMLGYSADELMQMTWTHITHPDDLSKDVDIYERMLRGEIDNYALFKRYIHKSGRVIDAALDVRCNRKPDGMVDYFISTIDDITERNRAELALQQSENLLREAQQAANIGCYNCHFDTGIWEATPVLNEIFGISASYPHTSEGWLAFIHPDFTVAMDNHLQRAIHENQPFDAEYKIIRPRDGEERWMHGLGKIVYDDQGQALSLLGTVQDITERKQDELYRERLKQLHSDLSRMRNAILHSSDETHLFDLICRIPVESGLMDMVWIGLEEPQSQRILPRYCYGKGVEYLEGIVISTLDSVPEGQGPTGIAWRTQKPVVNQDTLSNPQMHSWRERCAQFGWQSSASLPILRNNNIYALLTVYNLQPQVFDEAVLSLLDALASDVSFALDRMDSHSHLEESEARNQALINAIPDLIFMNRRDGEYLMAFPAVSERFFVPPEVFLQRNVADVLPGPIATLFQQGFKAALDSGCLQVLNYDLQLANDVQSFEARLMPTTNDRVITLVRDITEAKRAEAKLDQYRWHLEQLVAARTQELEAANLQLKLSEERYAFALSATKDGLWDWNLQSNISYLSNTYFSLLGYNPGELSSNAQEHFFALIHPEDQARVQEAIVARLRHENNYQVEFRIQTKAGAYKWILSRGQVALRNAAGEPIRVIGTHTDLTERKHWEIALRNINAEQQAIFDAASSGIVLMQNRTILRCNRRLEEIFGYAAGELDGQATRLWYPDAAAYERGGHAEYQDITAGNLHRCEQQLRRKDGRLFWARMIGRALDYAHPERGVVGIFEDITAEREATAALQHAKEIAEAAVKVKAQFLANMSHEIRTPMNAVLGFCYLLEQRPLESEAQQLVQKIHTAGRSLLMIINDILDFSKIEAGRLDIEHAPFRLSALLDELADMIMASPHKNLELIISPCSSVDTVIGDKQRIQQVLLNLLSNALKFTAEGEVELRVELLSADAEQLTLTFSVRDTGIGIAAEKQAEIFSAFTQADASISRRYGGSGLGLAISRQLVQLMGGVLAVNSQLQRGSEFSFSLALARHTTVPEKVAEPQALTLLIADDCAAARAGLVCTSKTLGWYADTVDSGSAVLAKVVSNWVQQKTYDVLLLDWNMSGKDGLQTAQAVRETLTDSLSTTLIILMVAASAREVLQAQAGMQWVDGILCKPITPSALHDAILALRQPKNPAPAEGIALLPPAAEAALSLDGMRILLVDDSEFNLELAQMMLESSGAMVHLADNGQTALDWLHAHPEAVDVILMDVQMPLMDGYTAARLIREDIRWRDLPIIAFSAGAFKDEQDLALAAGMNDFVAKPFVLEQLIAIITRLTTTRQPWQHATS